MAVRCIWSFGQLRLGWWEDMHYGSKIGIDAAVDEKDEVTGMKMIG